MSRTHCSFGLRIFFALDWQHSGIVVLTFPRVKKHVELASEYLLSHQLSLDVGRPSQPHVRVDVKLFGHVLDATRHSVGLDCLRASALLIEELLVIVMRKVPAVPLHRNASPGILLYAHGSRFLADLVE